MNYLRLQIQDLERYVGNCNNITEVPSFQAMMKKAEEQVAQYGVVESFTRVAKQFEEKEGPATGRDE